MILLCLWCVEAGEHGARSSMRARWPEQQTCVVHYVVAAAVVCSGQQRIFLVFFSPFLPPYHPLHYTSLHHTRHFDPCRRPFIVFLSSAGFRSCHRTSGKRRQRLAAADGRLKITATFLFFCFLRCSETFSSGRNPTVCLRRQHNSIPWTHNAFAPKWIPYCIILFHII